MNNALATSDTNYPNGPCVTNIDSAMQLASVQPELADTSRANFAVLITDGSQYGCNLDGGNAGTEAILTQMHAAGVSTFVVGFGSGTNPTQMDKFATAGGVPLSGSPMYYQADNAAQLEMALGTIAASVIGCTYELATAPDNGQDIFVFFDNAKVPRDPAKTEGWEYDSGSNQLTFYGTACDQLKAKQVSDVDVVFGCDEPTPE